MFKKISRACLLALLACPVAALAEPIYTMSFLPAGFDGRAMNGAGHIVGQNSAGVGIWNGSSLIDLGLGANSYAYAINSRGDVAGSLNGPTAGPSCTHPARCGTPGRSSTKISRPGVPTA